MSVVVCSASSPVEAAFPASDAKLRQTRRKQTTSCSTLTPPTYDMANYEGIATMYLTMPMAAQALPVLGSCTVNDKKISLKFPLTNVSFDLPEAPREGARDMEFKMAGAKGDMTLVISYKSDLRGFVGSGKQDGSNVLTFVFYRPESPLNHLKSL